VTILDTPSTMTTAVAATGQPTSAPPHVDPAAWARFAAQVAIIPGGCHLWIGAISGDGYGRAAALPGGDGADADLALFPVERPRVTHVGAHRVAWSAWHGPVPAGLWVRHHCDEPLCAPVLRETVDEHLAVGTPADNAADRRQRGRSARRSHGLVWAGADVRGPHGRSTDLRSIVRALIRENAAPADLAAAVAEVSAFGDPDLGQLALM